VLPSEFTHWNGPANRRCMSALCDQVSSTRIPFCDCFNLLTNKHQEQRAFSFIWSTAYWGTQILGKFLLEKETIEARQSLPHQEANLQRLPSRGLLRVWHLFLFSLSNLALVLSSLPPSTSRSLCWQGAGVNSWSLPLERSAHPAGSTLTLLHFGDRQTAHKQVSIIVPLHCQERIYGCDLPGAEEMLSEGTHEGNCSGCHNVLQG